MYPSSDHLAYPRYKHVRPMVENGDMMVVKNLGMVSWSLLSPASHIGMLLWREADQNTLSVAESREFKGGRIVSFSSQVRAFEGRIDIYRPKPECPYEVRERAATIAYNWAGRAYNYPGIKDLAIDRLPLIRFFAERWLGYKRDRSSMVLSSWEAAKYCSQLYVWAYRRAKYELGIIGSWEPCPGKNDAFVTPADLIESSGFDLIATNIQL